MKNPSKIKNKLKRNEVYAKYKQQKKTLKKKLRSERIKEVEALGEKAPPKQVQTILAIKNICRLSIELYMQIPRTLENSKEIDETTVQVDDEEVFGDEVDDEFSKYYSNDMVKMISQ